MNRQANAQQNNLFTGFVVRDAARTIKNLPDRAVRPSDY